MLTGTCHCGAVKVTIPRKPRSVADCNCSICRRYGTLWAYYKAATVTIDAKPKALQRYAWGTKTLNFLRCATCGCVVAWQRVRPDPELKMGINTRMFDPPVMNGVRVVQYNGASDW